MLPQLNVEKHNTKEQSQDLASNHPLFELEEKLSVLYIEQSGKEGKEDIYITSSHLKDAVIQRGLAGNVRKSTQRTGKHPNQMQTFSLMPEHHLQNIKSPIISATA